MPDILRLNLSNHNERKIFWRDLIQYFPDHRERNFVECRLEMETNRGNIISPWFGVRRDFYIVYYKNYPNVQHTDDEIRIDIVGEDRNEFRYLTRDLNFNINSIETHFNTLQQFPNNGNLHGETRYMIRNSMNPEVKAITFAIFLISEATRFEIISRAINNLLSNTKNYRKMAGSRSYDWKFFDPLIHHWNDLRDNHGFVSRDKVEGYENFTHGETVLLRQLAAWKLINPRCRALGFGRINRDGFTSRS